MRFVTMAAPYTVRTVTPMGGVKLRPYGLDVIVDGMDGATLLLAVCTSNPRESCLSRSTALCSTHEHVRLALRCPLLPH